MINKLKLIHVLIFFVAIISGFGVYTIMSPVTDTSFNQGAASQDTTSFTNYAKGEVSEVAFEQIDDAQNNKSITQRLKVLLDNKSGPREEVVIDNTQILDQAKSVQYKVGDKVVVGVLPASNDFMDNQYVIVDHYRLSGVYIVLAVFLLLAVVVGKWRGVTSLIGLGITGCILLFFIAPQILAGKNAFMVSLVGAGAIILVSMFISHGFNKRIQVAALSTLITLAVTGLITYLFVNISKLFGLGQSDAFLLQTGFLGNINLKGVLLAGIIISVLGILDDITTAQTAAVEELYKIDSILSVKELYNKGLSIGREHIASLINTLILVYAGAALPLFLLLTLQKSQPIWVLLNSEFISEELVRSLVGSTALILAVPISTILAAYVFTRNQNKS